MVALAPFAAAAALAIRADGAKSGDMFGLKAGFYFPSSQALRDALGNQWFSFGLTRVRGSARSGVKTVWDIEIAKHKSGDNKLAMLTPSIALRKDFAEPGAKTFPFLIGGVGLSYFDYTLTTAGNRSSTKRIGPSLYAQAGYIVDGRFIVSLRYNLMPSYDGYGFSGFSISAGYSFFRFQF